MLLIRQFQHFSNKCHRICYSFFYSVKNHIHIEFQLFTRSECYPTNISFVDLLLFLNFTDLISWIAIIITYFTDFWMADIGPKTSCASQITSQYYKKLFVVTVTFLFIFLWQLCWINLAHGSPKRKWLPLIQLSHFSMLTYDLWLNWSNSEWFYLEKRKDILYQNKIGKTKKKSLSVSPLLTSTYITE